MDVCYELTDWAGLAAPVGQVRRWSTTGQAVLLDVLAGHVTKDVPKRQEYVRYVHCERIQRSRHSIASFGRIATSI